MAEPLGAKERVDLRQSLGLAESQVRRDHLDPRAADLDRDPKGAARLQSGSVTKTRKCPRLHELRRPTCQNGVSVFFLHHPQRRMEEHVHAKLAGDGVRLIDAARPNATDVELLKTDDIGLTGSDDLGYPLRRQAPVHAEAAVHVVGEDARHLFTTSAESARCATAHVGAIAGCGNKGGERHSRGVSCSFTPFRHLARARTLEPRLQGGQGGLNTLDARLVAVIRHNLARAHSSRLAEGDRPRGRQPCGRPRRRANSDSMARAG